MIIDLPEKGVGTIGAGETVAATTGLGSLAGKKKIPEKKGSQATEGMPGRIIGGAMNGPGNLGGKERTTVKAASQMTKGMPGLQMARISASRGTIPLAQNNPEVGPNAGPITVRQKDRSNAVKTGARMGKTPIIIPAKGGIPAGGGTAAADVRITEAPGLMGMMRKKAISSE